MRSFRFQPKKSFVFKVASSKTSWWLERADKFKNVFLILTFLAFSLIVYNNFFETILNSSQLRSLKGGVLLFTAFAIFSWITEAFFNFIKDYRPVKESLSEALESPEPINLASYTEYSLAKTLSKAQKTNKTNNINKIPVDVLVSYLLESKKLINFIFSRLLIDKDPFQEQIKNQKKSSLSAGKTLYAAAKRAAEKEQPLIGEEDLLVALAKKSPLLRSSLLEFNLRAEDVERLVDWYEFWTHRVEKAKQFWRYENLARRGALAKNWAAAYTLTLDQYSVNWTEKAKERGGRPEILGHESEIEQIENILASSGHNNVLLVGQPGSGQKDITLSLAAKSFWKTSLPDLNNKRVLELNLASLVSKNTSSQEIEFMLDKCFQEAISAGNVILVMNNIHQFLGKREVGTVNIVNILTKYLESSRFQVIAITSYEGFHQQINRHSSLKSLFTQVEVVPPNIDQTFKILQFKIPYYEEKYSVFVPYLSLKKIVEHSARYFQKKPFPQKALELLDEVLVYVSRFSKKDIVLPEHIDKVVAEKTKIPVGNLERDEKEVLLNLENLIHERLINQEEAVQEVSSSLRRARTQITTKRKQPMGSFLFLGPTGVGKTETAKTLADIYFGSQKRMIRLDMSEFQNIEDISRLIGDEENTGLLTSQVQEEPFSLVLIDEIEKAHPNILNLFLTILDEGYITDGRGQDVRFSDTIIICTSNAGAEKIRQDIEKDKKLSLVKQELIDHLLKKNIFR